MSERSMIMKYELWYDEGRGVLYLKTFTLLTREDIEGLLPLVEKHFEGKPHRHLLADMSENPAGFVDQEARRLLKSEADSIRFDKFAVVGASPATRMITKIAITLLGKSDVSRFFKTEEEALAWLKKEM